jgi:hypothetical protein
MTAQRILNGIMLAVIAVLAWMVWQKPVAGPVNAPQDATDAPAVAGKGKEAITPPKVLAYSQSAKKKAKIPDSAKNDPALAILDSSTIPASSHSQTVTETLNVVTGETNAVVTTDPYPWLAMESEKRFTLAYMFKNGGAKVFRFQYAHEFVQIKALHFGPLVTLDTDGQGFAGLAVRW